MQSAGVSDGEQAPLQAPLHLISAASAPVVMAKCNPRASEVVTGSLFPPPPPICVYRAAPVHQHGNHGGSFEISDVLCDGPECGDRVRQCFSSQSSGPPHFCSLLAPNTPEAGFRCL